MNDWSRARAANLPSDGVARAQPVSPDVPDWSQRRAPLQAIDTHLGRLALAWSIRLDRQIHPAELLKLYPRIANRLALCWDDPLLAGRFLDSLVNDQRGGRKGFPVDVMRELLRLRRLFPQQKAVVPGVMHET